ncbi:MAG: AbrB/MazE/SpoVT family DNA-binding domain-containing protein [Dehalococcoidia bacterium]|nr:MAG: AbrB/MazE/SpoVT family DNA-binding domain-containing protein [bacterium]MCE7927681.1 AbrB/MazE/SpoVT family DNA-binding domain-containing protein [Chloroflexi bacterium CFX7]MCK6563210.1 AbrB/MazE/SpoVT family DNA-binding domain-containing protein [Dehalococcoidia bacterium]MCL4232522.1 AbrB/MazE/SpoVT family DNA-binding domain-containing protein [Dehalococcoidia bacterium]NUQ55789.1 AbrB/MazE/SpoVT family DNA-binding domain-containing protein [Dehalococcoidia bacterium]
MTTVRTRLAEGGRVVIPAAFRRALGLRVGDQLTLSLVDSEIRVASRVHGWREARDLLRPFVEGTASMADELIAERREQGQGE